MYENNIYNMKISDSNLISPDKSQKTDMYEMNITSPTIYKSYEAISDDRWSCSDFVNTDKNNVNKICCLCIMR